MRLSSASLAVLAALDVMSSAEFGAVPGVSSSPAPSRRRSTRSPWSIPFFRPRGRTGPAREDRSPAGLARIAAAEAKRASRCSRNLDQALRGGWGAVAREDALRARTVV